VRDRIVAELMGVEPPGVPTLTEPSVLVARDLAPADTAGLDPSKVAGPGHRGGCPTSHTAILARSLGIPAVVATTGLLALGEVHGLIVDGDTGVVEAPSGRVEVMAAAAGAQVHWDGVGITYDGNRIKILANVGSAATRPPRRPTGPRAWACSAPSSATCRQPTSRPWPSRPPPTARCSSRSPQAGHRPHAGRRRGQAAGLPRPRPGAQPALGVRGLRVAFTRTGVLDRQLEAIAAAAAETGAQVQVMARWSPPPKRRAGSPSGRARPASRRSA